MRSIPQATISVQQCIRFLIEGSADLVDTRNTAEMEPFTSMLRPYANEKQMRRVEDLGVETLDENFNRQKPTQQIKPFRRWWRLIFTVETTVALITKQSERPPTARMNL